jgi:hypothetical protein
MNTDMNMDIFDIDIDTVTNIFKDMDINHDMDTDTGAYSEVTKFKAKIWRHFF